MVFSSPLFLFLYLPITLLIYYVSPFRWRNIVLFVFNLIFYGWGEPVYLILMVGSIAMDYFFGIKVEKHRHSNDKRARLYVLLSMVCNLVILGIFKYLDFIIENLQLIPGLSGLETVGLALPIGISFYTFQKMSYIIDVYRGDALGQKNFISFGVYVTLFPQLIAGPIVKYKDVDDQLTYRTHTVEQFASGVTIFTAGLAKKVLLANAIGPLWDYYNATGEPLTVLGSWLGLLAYTFQIYFDFSGYSDMAIGLGRMLGFEFKINFNYPYIARSITDFWRRWHISMTSWFREYLYIPLGGNRCKKSRWFLNIFIVWAVSGLWHGASWNFVIWGVYFAIILVVERLWLGKVLAKIPRVLSHIYSIILIVVGWSIFAPNTLGRTGEFLMGAFGLNGAGFAGAGDVYQLMCYLPLLVVLVLASLPVWTQKYRALPAHIKAPLTWILLIAVYLLATASLVDSTYNP
ncbi:MAG: MBOAT family protein, partial [Firmicutes bacterium]|nr:MBOAT family protein [Bacillota bacterium]